ncbi:MAG: putative toxin-antitoxin system toxin component, PIN family [Candidatus Delongbacteria bacterium]|nr:putative toxin-antitoxin system toxin component, PIN family [Candidatus Delongbacteria bacterium]MCG2761012.1 putative toxin-antitoxin system toxin component, PIN family [Candidatus Delongbacteria bacterium]
MRIVFDSNVILAAFASRGLCAELFESCITAYDIVLNKQIIDEVSGNLSKKLKMPNDKIELIVNFLMEFCTFIETQNIPEKLSRDPDDDGIINLALESGSEYIITGDKDLLVIKEYKSIKMLTPRSFLEIK